MHLFNNRIVCMKFAKYLYDNVIVGVLRRIVCCDLAESVEQSRVKVNAGKFVSGLIYIDNKILVINFSSDTIKRFEGRPPYNGLSDVIIPGQKISAVWQHARTHIKCLSLTAPPNVSGEWTLLQTTR
jgi:hypothetical protein